MATFNFKITIATTEYDVTPYVGWQSIKKSNYLFKDLKPNTDTLQFQLSRDFPQLGLLLGYDGLVLATVTKDDAPYFTGYLTKDYQTAILAATGQAPISLTIEDPGIVKLQKAWESADTLSTQYPGYNICDKSNTSQSVVHLIAALAGVTVSDTVPNILKLVYVKVTDSEKKTYWEILATILYEYGYVFHFGADGKLNIFNIVQSGITPTATLSSDTNVMDSIVIQKALKQYDQANVSYKQWEWHPETENYLIYDETSGRSSSAKECYQFLSLSNYPYYQPGSTTLTQSGGTPKGTSDSLPKQVSYYDVRNGKEIIYVISATIDVVDLSYVSVQQFTPMPKAALIKIKANQDCFLRRVKIWGQGVMVNGGGSSNVYNTVTSQGGGNTVLEYQAEYANTKEDAQALANLLQQFYKYSIFGYTFTSSEDLAIGQIVTLQDPAFIGLDVTVIISQKTTSIRYEGGVATEAPYIYKAIGTGEFDTSLPVDSVDRSTSTPSSYQGSLPTYETLDDGTVAISGSIGSAGLVANGDLWSSNYILDTAGFKLYSDGRFEFNKDANNRFYYDGTDYTFKGNLIANSGELQSLDVTGTLTLTTGSIVAPNFSILNTGDISLGTGNNIIQLSASDSSYVLWAGNAIPGSAPLTITKAGAITASNITVTGGSIAAFTASSNTLSATNLVLNSGAANTANITVGSSSNSAGLNSASTGTDVAFWSGSSFANRATASFRVLANGQLTASNATIQGAITATSGSFTGQITTSNLTANGGTIANWIINTGILASAAANNARIELNSTLQRVSILDSLNSSKVVMGYLSGLARNGTPWDSGKTYSAGQYASYSNVVYKSLVGSNTNHIPSSSPTYWTVSSDVWSSSDYGFWVAPNATQLTFDGPVSVTNADYTVSEGNVKLTFNGSERVRLGADTGLYGLFSYGSNGFNSWKTLLYADVNGTLNISPSGLSNVAHTYTVPILKLSDSSDYWNNTAAFLQSYSGTFGISGGSLTAQTILISKSGSGVTYGTGLDIEIAGQSYTKGVSVSATNGTQNIGFSADVSSTVVGSNSYGFYANATGNQGTKYAYYASASGTGTNYSFYGANGNIYNNGNLTITGTLSAGTLVATALNTANSYQVTGLTVTGTLTATLTGNASTATKLATARTIALSGDVTGSTSFDGSANVTITATVADNSHNHTSANISDATNANTANMIVKRDASGNFSAGTITANLTGTATTANGLNASNSYTVNSNGITGANIRNITLSTASPTGGSSGDIWIMY